MLILLADNVVNLGQRPGAGTFGIRENVESGDIEAVNEVARCLKQFARFASGTDNEVNADKRIRNVAANGFDAVAKQSRVLATKKEVEQVFMNLEY